ncbi:hypothetical protein HWV62_30348 [Athelia sp. TMB]|nr:hypothetical protein HWV62_30348 [Athelia sp. TMB]
MDDVDMMAAMGITGFGKAAKKTKLDPTRFDKNKRGEGPPPAPTPPSEVLLNAPVKGPAGPPPPEETSEPEFDPDDQAPPLPPPATKLALDAEPEYDPSEPEYEAEEDHPQFPTTHEIILKDHTKVVSALTLDPSGARVLSGSHDYDVKLWDFGGMDSRCKPFKSWEPAGTYYIHDLKYSNDGQRFLVISGTSQAKLFDRDGEETIWDVEDRRKQKSVIVVKSKERGARTRVNACAYSPDGNMIGGACVDGAVHMWQANSNFVRPNMTIEGAHTKGTETGSLIFSIDGRTVLTRGGDDTVKRAYSPHLLNSKLTKGAVWDLRAFKKPLSTRSGLGTLYPGTNAIFSPDDKHVVSGAAATSKGGKGSLLVLNKNDLEEVVTRWEVAATPVKVLWHSKINQIVTGLSNGEINVFYSPLTSINGAKLLLSKGPPRKRNIEDVSDAQAAPNIITPHELPMFRDQDATGSKRKREKERMDPKKSRRPELPVTGPGRGGRVGASATQHVVQNLVRDTTRDEDVRVFFLSLKVFRRGGWVIREGYLDTAFTPVDVSLERPILKRLSASELCLFIDVPIVPCDSLLTTSTRHILQPREALLKYAKLAEEDPQWTGAWKQNQPNPVFQEVEQESEKEEVTPRCDSHAYSMNDALAIPTNGAAPHPDHPHTNGNGDLDAHPDSPTTPVDHTVSAIDIKMSMDMQEPESDVRHEPIPIRVDKLDHASVAPEVGTPLDPASIAIEPPSGTPPPPTGELLEDVKMAEETAEAPALEPVADVNMAELAAPNGRETNKRSREATPVASDPTAAPDNTGAPPPPSPSTHESSINEDDGSVPPPAKRARTFSENDLGSAMSATPPPVSGNSAAFTDSTATATNGATPAPASPSSGLANLSIAQFRFCQSTVRNLKKSKDAGPFLRPVDPVALNIPHYLTIVKNPMDFSTVERKLASSNPSKPDPNKNNPRYNNADEFITDVRLIFYNCVTFNGPDHPVTAMGKRVEDIFDKQIKNMPAAAEPVIPRKVTPPPPPPPVVKEEKRVPPPVRRPSTSVPVIRRSEAEVVSARPKREIHPPPPKDLPYADAPKKARKGKSNKDDGSAEQLKFCSKVLHDLNRKAHWAIANPFYEPVDYVALNLPSYPKIVKKPMDLSTMRKKLDANMYSNGYAFWEDFKLMIRNCFAFNPSGTPVNQAGADLQRLFDEKWKGLPPLRDAASDEEEYSGGEDSEDERLRTARFLCAVDIVLTTVAFIEEQLEKIRAMENQIEMMKANMGAVQTKPVEKKPKKVKKEKPMPVASSSKAPRPPKTSAPLNGGGKNRKGKKAVGDDDTLSFEQKKDLSEAIQTLDGPKLEKVIAIIHEGVPEIRDSTEEIELEIDLLPAAVLTKLYNFVLRPLRAPATKRSRTGKGTGTGGLKRKSMDEDVEAEKIRQLEERMRLFEQGNNPSAVPAPAGGAGSDHSSDSSDASDSSGSDSE